MTRTELIALIASTLPDNHSGAIKPDAHRNLVQNIVENVLQAEDIVNNLTSEDTDKPLSAAQGKALKELIDDLKVLSENNITNGTSISPDMSFDVNYMEKPTGNLTIAAPVNASLSRTQIVIADGNGVTLTMSSGYSFPEGNEAPTTLESGKRYEFTLYVYSGGDYKISWVKY